jgi:MoaA/NifB/PqqE/SkfB family radical SAM enzyme
MKAFLKAMALNKAIDMATKSQKNWSRVINILEHFSKNPGILSTLEKLKDEKYFKAFSRLKEINPNCRKKVFNNLVVNSIKGPDFREKYLAKHGVIPPYLLVISPTMRCNLRCIGCYAGEYTKEDDLPEEVFDRIIREAKEMGIHFITISGGEPFVNPWFMKMLKKHNDVFFQIYTNGTLINRKLAKELARLGNAAPAISVEGFESKTDERRGEGVYSKVLEAMKNLKEEGVIFGFSTTLTRNNLDPVATDEFIDFYIKQGCVFGWFFTYIPIGIKPNVDLMATPEQRCMLREKIREWRGQVKPIFIGDFWNDGQYIRGCIAAARQDPQKGAGYLHINCKGDVEPCVFAHFAVDNIKNKSLREVLQSDFFKALREGQSKIKNWLMPCCIIDNPEVLRNAVKKTGAYPTHPGAETIITDKKIIKHLDNYSKEMTKLTKDLWNKKERFSCSCGQAA